MSTTVSANVRALKLFVGLLGVCPRRTKARLCALPGYQGFADDAFGTQFQRDKDTLCGAGTHMMIRSGECYSIAWDSFMPGIEVTSINRALMLLAVRAWDSSEFFAEMVDAKVAAASFDGVSAPTTCLGLTGLGAATVLAQAICERCVVCFEYPGSRELTERSIEPQTLSVQDRALRLWRWDLNRSSERTSHVSRIRSRTSFIGEPGDASLLPEGTVFPRMSLFVSPVTDVRGDSIAHTLLHSYEAGAAPEGHGSPRHGWERVVFEGAGLGTWMGRLLPLTSDVAVVSPESLYDAMLTHLRAAAKWGEHGA